MDRPQSAWLDFLSWVQEPQQVVSNAVRGRGGAATRHLADFLAGPIDAVLPGDVLAAQARPEDEIDAGLVEQIALNPLTWAGLHPAVRKAVPALLAAGAAKTYSALPTSGKRLADETRRALGWDEYHDFVLPNGKTFSADAHLGAATGTEQTASQAGIQHLTGLAKVTPAENQALADVIDNLDYSVGKIPGILDPLHAPTQAMPVPAQIQAAKDRLRLWVGKNTGTPVDLVKLDKLLDETYAFNGRQLNEAKTGLAMNNQQAQPDYLMREFVGLDEAKATAGRNASGAAGIIKTLSGGANVELKRDWQGRMVGRAQKQGRMLKRAQLRAQLTDDKTALAALDPNDKVANAAINDAIAAAGPDSDIAARLRYELKGDVPPNAIEGAMRSLNSWFKPAAVYGVGPFMRVGSIVRNQLTAYWQLAGSPEGRAYLLKDPAHGIKNLLGAFDDGVVKNLGFKRLTGGEITESLDAVEAALKAGQGVGRDVAQDLAAAGRTIEAEALRHGVLNGFVMSEDLARATMILKDRVNPLTWVTPGASALADVGGKTFGGLEQRMRFAFFKHLMQQPGATPAAAAKQVQDRFLDYATNSAGNRSLRTYFPFAQFVVKSAKQQGKMLASTPALLPAVASLYGGDDADGLPGYAREQAHLGNVLPGIAPTDVFGMVPDLTSAGSFEEFQQSAAKTLGALHPALGAGIGLASGRDTFTGKPYMEDARLPGRDPRTTERNAADLAWGLGEDVGLTQMVAGPAQQVKSLGKMDPGAAALRYATGINVMTPDPLRAEADRLRTTVSADARVKSFESLYSKSPDDQLQAALKRLAEVRKELADKAQAATAAAGIPPGAANP